jgi:hypothetical protein
MEINIKQLKEYGILPQNFEEIAQQKFKEFDKNGNGFLEYDECAGLIMEVAKFMHYESFFTSENAKQRLYENFDQNGDKKFDFNEFKEKLVIQFINHYEQQNA